MKEVNRGEWKLKKSTEFNNVFESKKNSIFYEDYKFLNRYAIN